MVLLFMRLALFAERLSVGVEPSEDAHQVAIAHTHFLPPRAECRSVGRFFRPETSVAAARVRRAERAATHLGHRAEARRAMRYHHADRAALFALHADAVWRGVRLASIQKSAEDLDQLIFVDGAAPQLEINKHVVRDGSR